MPKLSLHFMCQDVPYHAFYSSYATDNTECNYVKIMTSTVTQYELLADIYNYTKNKNKLLNLSVIKLWQIISLAVTGSRLEKTPRDNYISKCNCYCIMAIASKALHQINWGTPCYNIGHWRDDFLPYFLVPPISSHVLCT